MTPDQKGAIAEAAIALSAMKLGLGVFKPLSDGERYDLILDLRPKLLRVQPATLRQLGGRFRFRGYNSR